MLDIVGSPRAVSADPDRIEQVLTNLLDNALKYSPDGAELRVRVQPKARGVLLEVQDHGIGIPPGMLNRIFDPFERAVSVRNYGGLGLGLFIVRTIVEGLGGTVRVESKPNAGSTFTVELQAERNS